MKLTQHMQVVNNELNIADIPVSRLKEEYGTPLYIYDQKGIKDQAKTFINGFHSKKFTTHIIYASKAFLNLYIAQLINEQGCYLDAVSGGEIYTLLAAGVPGEKIYFHGNNKTESEIILALEQGIGTFVIDSQTDFYKVEKIVKSLNKQVKVLLRINPGIEASTHKYIQTSRDDSKFGMSSHDEDTVALVKEMVKSDWLDFAGFHCHIGSQILEERFFFEEADLMFGFCRQMEEETGCQVREINLGGGFGVYYSQADRPFDYEKFLQSYIQVIEAAIDQYGLEHVDTVSIEPGRALINDFGTALYSVGGVKHTLAGKPFVFVDGGMSDNIRPALYQAKYEAALANRMNDEVEGEYRVAGKLCETGDQLVQDAPLPEARIGDLLVIPRVGAYTYTMSSNYNRLGRPALVFVEDGQSYLAVKRESYQDLLRNDYNYKNKED